MSILTLQIHITGKCNLRCKHCYIEEHAEEMPLEDIIRAFKQFDALVKVKSLLSGRKLSARINMTGGEPFLHSRIDEILDLLAEYSKKYTIGIMSNGSYLTVTIVNKLKKIGLAALQLSLDGNEQTHDFIRGGGNFETVVSAMDILYKENIPCRVSFTANSQNYTQLSEVARICRAHNVATLWTDRYIPFKKNDAVSALSPEQTKEYIKLINKEALNPINKDCGLWVQNHRALQFLGSQQTPYYCKAGEYLVTIDEKGNIMPCRRLPIVCGNINKTTLLKTYFLNKTFKKLRKHTVDRKCLQCKYSKHCKGGLRCLSYAVNGDFESCDPGCFL